MLKALELNGFKSFADKTRLEFPPGITVVVGPNGSGKSNIVDAMKWVLGEQSARSLRGKEMADVIFKGSGSGNRRPANTAEVTIIFDNSEGLLAVDAPEVHVTRRVYRSGEGEYLINNQSCRLRDIKDMFRGTGVGTDAYSIIEQGKVDMLLQASTRDRRAIFEEAAGISRFKAKKVEAQRRLERVDQNLLRLSDIVDEVESRLRRLKSQATKAQRYREYTQRLQELRTQVGRVDWQRLSGDLGRIEAEVAELGGRREQEQMAIDALETRRLDLDANLAEFDTAIADFQQHAGRTRETIASDQSTLRHARQQAAELAEEVDRFRRRLLAMSARAGGLQSQLRETRAQAENASADHESRRQKLATEETQLHELSEQWHARREATEALRARHVEQVRRAAELVSERSAHETAIEAAQVTQQRLAESIRDLEKQLDAEQRNLRELIAKRQQLEQDCRHREAELQALREQLAAGRTLYQTRTDELAVLRQRLAATRERSALLQEIESRLEDVGAGVKDVLRLAGAEDPGPFAGVHGMVADLLRVTDPHMAVLVEAALGDRAQHIVVAGSRLIEFLQQEKHDLSGRVGLLRLESSPPLGPAHRVDLTGQVGVLGRADRWVATEAEYQHLLQWLLGTTWFVRGMADAVQLRRSLEIPLRFVTARGEIVEADGRLLVGPDRGRVGLISRRAELQTLQAEIARLEQVIEQSSDEIVQLQRDTQRQEATAVELAEVFEQVARDSSETRVHEQALEDRLTRAQKQLQMWRTEAAAAATEVEARVELLAANQHAQDQCDQQQHELEEQLQVEQAAVAEVEGLRQQREVHVTAARVELAKSEQRFDALRTQLEQLQRDQDERDRALSETRQELQRRQHQYALTCRQALRATASLADQYLQEQQNAHHARQLLRQRDQQRSERDGLNNQLHAAHRRLQKVQQALHVQEMEGEKLRHERATLAERLEEDYGIQVADLEAELSEEERAERDQVDQEIAELRRKLTNIGSVNMDALSELEDLEQRYSVLSSQHRDLVEAKESLERIIQKINADSRRLFAETLEAIRQNFQVLFRKVFGGGSADIVLEEGVDMLESGIDIVATPPGKNSLGLSLLSGGERALTAVTLLLAIFQYRPSPFCVLDEVDGPLDEANIGRFVDVLNEFLQWTKFVVVTHSKKTMTAAHTLYGVTMQESGVSKRVSVRFEDVSEDGEISREALDRDTVSDPSDDERGAA